MKKIAILISGSGSNLEAIINACNSKEIYGHVVCVISNNPDAYGLERAKKFKINTKVIDHKLYLERDKFDNDLQIYLEELSPDLIVLAGFLWKIPEKLIKAFPDKIINIHPALLPKFGGKGMYGINIHNAVIEKKETKSGITIHYVNKNYDEGEVIFQKTIEIKKNETPEELSSRILKLEHNFFPRIINQVLESGK